jgi:hypothetical protein
MKILRLLVVLPLFSLSLAAHADNLRLPADAPPAFQAECASCHLAFPPQLLAAEDWKRVMASLDKHYGDNASLDAKTRAILEDFLVRNAGKPEKVGAGGTAPRLTSTPWFKRKHHEVPRADWTHAKVKTPANCAACHTKAAEGSYREREIIMPNGKKWEN